MVPLAPPGGGENLAGALPGEGSGGPLVGGPATFLEGGGGGGKPLTTV